MNCHLPENKETQLIYTGIKLGNRCNIKNVTQKEHQHDLIYSVKFLLETCNESYNFEIARLVGRVSDHIGKDRSSHMNKHSIEIDHLTVKLEDFEILSRRFRERKLKRQISETLFIKGNKP